MFPVSLANLPAESENCMQHQSCWQYTAKRIRQFKFKKQSRHLKLCVSSAIHVLINAQPPLPLSGRSNLVRRYLYMAKSVKFLKQFFSQTTSLNLEFKDGEQLILYSMIPVHVFLVVLKIKNLASFSGLSKIFFTSKSGTDYQVHILHKEIMKKVGKK